MKFYFAGVIRGDRKKLDIYIQINKLLEKYGEILDKHIINPNVNTIEENNSLEKIYNRDINWIKDCNILVAEVSIPSLGIGYEISYAESLGKRIICLCEEGTNLSAMIGGNKNIELIKYKDIDDLIAKIEINIKVDEEENILNVQYDSKKIKFGGV